MVGKRDKSEEVVSKPRQVEVLHEQGDDCRSGLPERLDAADILSVAQAFWRNAAVITRAPERA